MRINPIAHGRSNNLYCTVKNCGVRLKMQFFFDTETAYIMSCKRKNPEVNLDWDKFYQNLKQAVADMDFVLITPRKGFVRLNMSSNQFKYHLKERYGL